MDNITGIRYAELERRPTYEELIDVIVKDFKVKLPDRTATLIYNSPEIQNLLKGDVNDIEEHELRKYKEEVKEIEIKKQASTSTQTAQQIRTQEQGTSTFEPTQVFDMTLDDRIDDAHEDIADNLENHAHNLKQQQRSWMEVVRRHLGQDVTPGPLNFAHKLATGSKSQSSTDVPHFAQDTPMPSKEPANPEIPTHTSSNTGPPPPPPPAAGAVTTETTGKPRRRERARSENDVLPRATPKAKANPAGIDGPATAPVPASVTTRGRSRARATPVKREVKQEGFAPPPPPPAAPAVTTETTGKPKARGERSRSKDPPTRAATTGRGRIKKEIKEEILPTPPPPPPPPKVERSRSRDPPTRGRAKTKTAPVKREAKPSVTTETTGKPKTRGERSRTPGWTVKKEEIERVKKDIDKGVKPVAEAKNEVKLEAKATKRATAVKSKAKPKVQTTSSSSDQPTTKAEKLNEPPKPRAAPQKRKKPEPGGPEASQRPASWWNKFKKADIIKEIERLGGVVSDEDKKNLTKAEFIKKVKEL